ncbi:DUF2442 domain-containing protein [Nitrospirillum viridazoti]|uniref:Uncharacterized protein DUF2442 n=1 Tax=Nitrospirillum amazonense TaxID=28077 RepID=A0A560IMS3_9PROT|nr:DUF2442 domain-containing protein [Nitrospirillum amazonense]TWB59485.1 uncharacterized protein DUF2442 [Nitrospirillum amazonense]
MAELTTAAFEAAQARGEERLRAPRAVSAHYDASRDRVIVLLTTGIEVGFPPGAVEGLAGAAAADLAEIEVEAFGLGLHFPRLDADLYVPALLEGLLGTKRWMGEHSPAAVLGASGGRKRGGTKAMAARENGKRGGRPKKISGI